MFLIRFCTFLMGFCTFFKKYTLLTPAMPLHSEVSIQINILTFFHVFVFDLCCSLIISCFGSSVLWSFGGGLGTHMMSALHDRTKPQAPLDKFHECENMFEGVSGNMEACVFCKTAPQAVRELWYCPLPMSECFFV